MASLCENFPCHKDYNKGFNCEFCYCPLYKEKCEDFGGKPIFQHYHRETVKDCTECLLPHEINFKKDIDKLDRKML